MINSPSRFRPVFFSLLLLAYFTALLLVNYFELDFVLIGVIGELLTIPALLALIAYLGYNFWRAFRAERRQRGIHWIAVALLLSCVIMLGWKSF